MGLTLNRNGPNKIITYYQDKKTSSSDNTKGRTILKIAGFATVNEFSNMIGVSSTNVIRYFTELGFMVSLNQRLDTELLLLGAYEFGYIGEDIYDYPKNLLVSK